MLRPLLLCVLALTACTEREPEPPAAGVPLTLAEQRVTALADVHYDAHFDLPADRTQPVTGDVAVRFTLRDAGRQLCFRQAEARGHIAKLPLGLRNRRGLILLRQSKARASLREPGLRLCAAIADTRFLFGLRQSKSRRNIAELPAHAGLLQP